MNLLSVAPTIVFAWFTVGTVDARDARPPSADARPPSGPGAVAPPAGPPSVAQLVERIDELHRHRDDKTVFVEEQAVVQQALSRAPQEYEVLWRAARVSFWASDDTGRSNDERSRIGKDGWDLAERAIAANPNRVEGQYWAAVCMGNYALGLGVVKALSMGMEGKFRERLSRAEQLDARYEHGGIATAWGRFFAKLPWPKRDRGEAERRLRRAIEINPYSLRARVYLAGTYLDDDRPTDAKRLLDEVSAAAAGRYDPPEERRAKGMGADLMPRVAAKLK